MNRQAAIVALMLGGALLAVGLFLGFATVTSSGVDCGSGFSPDQNAGLTADFRDSLNGSSDANHKGGCADATGSRKTTAVALLIPGGIIAFIGAASFSRNYYEDREQAAAAT